MWVFAAGSLAFLSCGGGGGGGGGSRPDTFFVRASMGDDANSGKTPASALRTIGAAVARATDGDTIVVGPGRYVESVVDPPAGTASGAVTFLADRHGTMTGDAPRSVVVDAGRGTFGFRLTRASYVVIDGFTVTGATATNGAGIFVRASSDQVEIRNCELVGNRDGIRIEDSADVLVFNNLVTKNANRGVRIAGGRTGSRATRLINNTLADNGNDGVSIGREKVASGAVLRNNILQGNRVRNLSVASNSAPLVDENFNLIFPLTVSPVLPPGRFDVLADARFADSAGGDYHLVQVAVGAESASPAIDAGDPDMDGALRARLRERSTSLGGEVDVGRPDLGYHYPGRARPTATPTPTRRAGKTATPTPVPSAGDRFFVRASAGSDANDGLSPDSALRSIGAAASRARPGDVIIVGPGTYIEQVIDPPGGVGGRPVTFLADDGGQRTGDTPGSVYVDAGGGLAGFRVSRGEYIVIDGFVVSGGSQGAIQIRSGSQSITVRDCVLRESLGDGLRIQDSDDVIVFNNLVYGNSRRGIFVGGTVSGSQRVRLINNTVTGNGDRGLFVGTFGVASRDTLVLNNIVANNAGGNVQVTTGAPSSLDGYEARSNLVFPASYVPDNLPRPTDVNADPLFIDTGSEDFALSQRAAGQDENSPAVDAGDPATPEEYRSLLLEGTTASDGRRDSAPPDLGYHRGIGG